MSKLVQMLRLALIVLVTVLLTALQAGCSIEFGLGSTGSAGGTSGGDTTVQPLPKPSVQRAELPVLDADQQKRQVEVDQFLAKQYQAEGLVPLETIQTYDNDIVDCFDPSTVAGSDAEEPSARTEATMLPSGVVLSSTESDEHPELQCKGGNIPKMRPSFSAYVSGASGAKSVGDYLDNHVVVGMPGGPHRLYAGMATVAANQGAAVWLTAFGGAIEKRTLTAQEMIVGCNDGQGGMEWVGVAAVRDAVNQDTAFHKFGGSVPRVQVEYVIPDSTKPEGVGGGWDGLTRTRNVFKSVSKTYYPGMELVPATPGGPQIESYFVIQLFKGNWWVGYNGFWLGYYESTLFKHLSSEKACVVQWYGEVFAANQTLWTWTDMGSGEFADQGFGKAAYFRDPFYADSTGKSQWPDISMSVSPANDNCYTRSALFSASTPWDRWFFVGGPGNKHVGCE